MKIIDRYIFKQFLTTYVFVVLVMVSVICVIDYSEKSDDFLRNNVSAKEIFVDYYFNFVIYITNMISPLLIFIATVFVTSRLAARTEFIAMISGGISYRRLMLPYLLVAILVASGTFYLNGWVIPQSNKARVEFEVAYIKRPFSYDERNVHFKIAPNVYAYMQSYNNRTHTGRKFTLEKIIDNRLVEKLSAEIIKWDSLKKSWHIEDYMIHRFTEEREYIVRTRGLDTLLPIRPQDFESKHNLHETMTFKQLDNYIEEQLERGQTKDLGKFYVEKYQRFASPFAIIILTFMGVTVSSKKSRQGTSAQIAIGFILAFIFLIFVIIGRSMGQNGAIPPQLSVWIANIIFAVVAVYLYIRAPK
ncbi:MAG: LptF/LptG family permease [Bernardetiaceae bacterium]|nr:LptF/LptG family permease [Bernardetiaceae bacterium]